MEWHNFQTIKSKLLHTIEDTNSEIIWLRVRTHLLQQCRSTRYAFPCSDPHLNVGKERHFITHFLINIIKENNSPEDYLVFCKISVIGYQINI
jgi:hypothetical protein